MIDTVLRAEQLAAEHDMSLHGLARHCNVPYTTLKNAKTRGTQLTVDTIEKICIGLHITFHEFFPGQEPK